MNEQDRLIKEFCTEVPVVFGTDDTGICSFSMFFDDIEAFVLKYNDEYHALIDEDEVVPFFVYYSAQYKSKDCDGYTMFYKQPEGNDKKLDGHIYIGKFYGVEY